MSEWQNPEWVREEKRRFDREAAEDWFADDDDDDDDEKCGADHAGTCDIRVTKSAPWGECQNTNHDDEPSAAALERFNSAERYFRPAVENLHLLAMKD